MARHDGPSTDLSRIDPLGRPLYAALAAEALAAEGELRQMDHLSLIQFVVLLPISCHSSGSERALNQPEGFAASWLAFAKPSAA